MSASSDDNLVDLRLDAVGVRAAARTDEENEIATAEDDTRWLEEE